MCGIVGYLGKRQAIEVLVEGFSKLEYRGYDSAGVDYTLAMECAWKKNEISYVHAEVESQMIE